MQIKFISVILAAMLVIACGKKEEAVIAPAVPVAEAPAPVSYTPTPTVDDSSKKAACRAESMEGYGTGIVAGVKMSQSDEDMATKRIYEHCMSK